MVRVRPRLDRNLTHAIRLHEVGHGATLRGQAKRLGPGELRREVVLEALLVGLRPRAGDNVLHPLARHVPREAGDVARSAAVAAQAAQAAEVVIGARGQAHRGVKRLRALVGLQDIPSRWVITLVGVPSPARRQRRASAGSVLASLLSSAQCLRVVRGPAPHGARSLQARREVGSYCPGFVPPSGHVTCVPRNGARRVVSESWLPREQERVTARLLHGSGRAHVARRACTGTCAPLA
mmetsp:Transcript_93346/g.253234  ORF Transcript_93346/g.253234 Transcript_93346/m.253234 type:complete len:237 (-) Transcript_93346:18-728(-)